MISKGQLRLTTKNHKDEPLITSVFYLDGDALNILYLKNGELLIEDYRDKLNEHQKELNKNIASLKVLKEQLVFILGVLSALLSFSIPAEGTIGRMGITGAFIAIGLLLRKYIFKVLTLSIIFIAGYFSRKFF